MIYLSPAPLYHSAPNAAVCLTLGVGGTVIIMEHFDPEQYLRLIEKYKVTHSQLVPTMFSRLLKLPPERAQQVRPLDAGDRHPCRRAVPGAGEGADDRMVGPDHPRVLRRHRRPGLHRLRQRTVAGAQGQRRQGDDRRPAHPGREHAARAEGPPGEIWFKTATPFVYFNDPERTQQTRSADGSDEHGGRRGLRRRRRLPVPDRPQHLHDHQRRRQHLSAGMREPADHPPQGGGCGGVRRAQRGDGRGGQGRGASRCRASPPGPSWRPS